MREKGRLNAPDIMRQFAKPALALVDSMRSAAAEQPAQAIAFGGAPRLFFGRVLLAACVVLLPPGLLLGCSDCFFCRPDCFFGARIAFRAPGLLFWRPDCFFGARIAFLVPGLLFWRPDCFF